jgi:hypothetical protein
VNARNDALLLWSHVFALSWIETQAKNNDRRFGLKKSHVTAAARSKKKKKQGMRRAAWVTRKERDAK